jgi:serine/threonine protein kinase
MEYMSLGSLYDVLHNELLPDIPHQLRIKMMRQAAKGMYFLHSSGTHLPTPPHTARACI